MKYQYNIEPLKFYTLHELPEAWSASDYKSLLEQMDFDGISEIAPDELKEMCLMALTDNDPEDAAKIVLGFVFTGRLTAGQIDNLSNEMLDEKHWEEYADLSMHEDFFNAAQLLYEAFNGKFPQPEAVRFQVKISAKNASELSVFNQKTEAVLLRLLVQGMPENTLLNRLFDEQLAADDFSEAMDIIWQLKKEVVDEITLIFDIISSEYWFHDYKYVRPYNAEMS